MPSAVSHRERRRRAALHRLQALDESEEIVKDDLKRAEEARLSETELEQASGGYGKAITPSLRVTCPKCGEVQIIVGIGTDLRKRRCCACKAKLAG